MKWNTTSTAAACLAGVAMAVFIGKISSGKSANSQTDQLNERAREIPNNRMTASRDGTTLRRDTAGRPVRSNSQRSDSHRSASTSDQRLTAMESIVRGENALYRSRAMLAWIDSLAPDEFKDAVARFSSLDIKDARMDEYEMLLSAWAEIDPAAALANTQDDKAIGTVLAAWASRDPDSAIAWAEANHDASYPYMIDIIRALAATNLTRATELLQGMSRSGGDALDAMIPHILQMGNDSAKQWISALSDEGLRDKATARFAVEMAKTDPAGTVPWLLANLGEASSRSVGEIFEHWAQTDSRAAMDYLGKLPAGDVRVRALNSLVRIVSDGNPQDAANLMDTYPSDVDLDQFMVHHFVVNSCNQAPALALSQINKISDESDRNREYELILFHWLNNDKASAQNWINSANVPESVLNELERFNKP